MYIVALYLSPLGKHGHASYFNTNLVNCNIFTLMKVSLKTKVFDENLIVSTNELFPRVFDQLIFMKSNGSMNSNRANTSTTYISIWGKKLVTLPSCEASFPLIVSVFFIPPTSNRYITHGRSEG